MNIEIVKYPGERGRQAVMVDGERWAIIHTSGGVPSKYWFQQVGNHGAVREISGKVLRTVYVYGERHFKRSRFTSADAPTTPPKPPLADRLLAEAKRLVDGGLIVSPAIVAQKIADKLARESVSMADRYKKEFDLFAAPARAALEGMEQYTKIGIPRRAMDEDVALIVELMKWAQSQ